MVGTVKISDIPLEATKDDIDKFFDMAGPFSIIRFDPPVAIIAFEDDNDADKALFLNGMEILGKIVSVEMHSEEDIEKGYHIISDNIAQPAFSSITIPQSAQPASSNITIPEAVIEEYKMDSTLQNVPKKSKPLAETTNDTAKERLQNVSLPARRKLDEKDPFAILMNLNVSGVIAFTTLVYLTLSSFWS
ncbi:unnamed protein product [Blepharisma stoltei]|uniref:RRM domain-containing protein n=1 Tax=Blepharisma stoltei TaxID=1481888 RepID=A0AAU9JL24_9CILI|nr:unnamed protein product [Blepharisma stoltei]